MFSFRLTALTQLFSSANHCRLKCTLSFGKISQENGCTWSGGGEEQNAIRYYLFRKYQILTFYPSFEPAFC